MEDENKRPTKKKKKQAGLNQTEAANAATWFFDLSELIGNALRGKWMWS